MKERSAGEVDEMTSVGGEGRNAIPRGAPNRGVAVGWDGG